MHFSPTLWTVGEVSLVELSDTQTTLGGTVRQSDVDSFSAITAGMASLTPKQRSMLLVLSDYGEPATISVLSDMTGLHANSVRETLSVLVEYGLVRRARVPSASRGRPAWEYESSVPADLSVIMREFSTFARAVCAYLETTSATPVADAEKIGGLWGQRLAKDSSIALDGSEGSHEVREHPLARLRILFSTLGFGAVAGADDQSINLTVCPFSQDGQYPNPLTCAMHKGMISAMLAVLSSDKVGADLVANFPGAPCVISLAGEQMR
ncbi:MAG: helix-turn-helix transcriptional regulator [Ancrocorticia sp.]